MHPGRTAALDRLRGAALVAMLVHHLIGWMTSEARDILPGWPSFALTDAAAPAFFLAAGASSALFVASRRRADVAPARIAGQLLRRYGLLVPIGMALRWVLWRDPFGLGVLEVLGLTVLAAILVAALVPGRLLPWTAAGALVVGMVAEQGIDGRHDWAAEELVGGKFPVITYLGFVLVGVAVARAGRLDDRRWVGGACLVAIVALVALLADGIVPDRYPGDLSFVVPGLAVTILVHALCLLDWPALLRPVDTLLRRAAFHTLGVFLAHYAIYYVLDRTGVAGEVRPDVAVAAAVVLTLVLCLLAPYVPQLPWSPRTGGTGRYMVSSKETSPSPRSTFLSSLPEALRGSGSVRSST